MLHADLPLVYQHQAADSNSPDDPIVLMIHGYGSHENDLFGLKDYLGNKCHLVSVRAPINLGMGGFAWYPINFSELGGKISDTAAAVQSRDLLRQFVAAFREKHQLTNNPLWLMGFSQGGILSYAYALSYPTEVKRVMALSAYVLKETVPEEYAKAELSGLDFFVSHGVQDEIIPINAARQSVAFLEKLKVAHQYREYPVGHGMNADNVQDLRDWFSKGLNP